MSTPLTIVAIIIAKEESRDLVHAELIKLIEPTLKEQGCIQYTLHQDNEDPNTFLFYETWESRELWQVHMQNANLAAFMEATEGAVEDLALHEMTQHH
ncbi:putative quinol monooxygenase [Haloferula sp.]|uniref:putative quinol monooxygenase n=1 Tax=Haloferula sp. TaxID=2497595 RepID=UPI00329B4EB7